jgi:RNA polymerase sigma factor (TIGR02999 family)
VNAELKTQVTTLLGRIRDGDAIARNNLLELVYNELRGLAGAVHGQQAQYTLQPTALVHEAWIKIADHVDRLESRRHFMAVAARAMRQVLADRARGALRQKRGGDVQTVALREDVVPATVPNPTDALDLVALDQALTDLTQMHERHARVVEMRLLGSMTMQEIADELDISKRTAEEDWTFARVWLRRQIKKHNGQ